MADAPEPSVTNNGAPSDPVITPEDEAAADAMLDAAEAAAEEEAAAVVAPDPVVDDTDDGGLSAEFNEGIVPEEPKPAAPEVIPNEPVKPAVEEPVVDAVALEPKPAEAVPEIDAEIAAIPEPLNLSEANKANWQKLRETASDYKKKADAAAALEARVKELEASPKIPDDYNELKEFRAIFDTEHDPEFKSKYETPITQANDKIYEILKKNGAPDAFIDSIKKVGGPQAVDPKWLKDNVLNKLDETNMDDADAIRELRKTSRSLTEQRDKEVKELAEKRPVILQERETKQRELFQQNQEEITKYTDEVTKNVPWARFQDVPETAAPEEKAKIEEHNARVGKLAEQYHAALWPTTPKERAAIAVSAVASQILTEQVKIEQGNVAALKAQLDAALKENSQLKGAGRLPKPGTTPSAPTKATAADRLKMSSDDAIDAGLDEAMGA
jgi:hypothetical protein